MLDTKKQRERAILDEVYAHRGLSEIEEHEGPDFLVRHHSGSDRFGVEVTEFYLSETDARMQRIEGYLADLLAGKDFRHKDDRERLEVTKITLQSAEGEIKAKDVPAIVSAMTPPSDAAENVADIIRKKDLSLTHIPETLCHVNLIIRDRSNMMSNHSASSFFALFCTWSLQTAILKSRFREVYYVTKFRNGCAYIPLRMVMVLAQMFLVDGFLNKENTQFETAEKFMHWFARYLCSIVSDEVRIREEADEVEVLHGDTGLLIRGESGLAIRNYSDSPLPQSAVVVRKDEAWDDLGAHQGMPHYEQSQVFECGLAFAVRTGKPLDDDDATS